jgi:HrpA-like RNA helicase
MAALGEHPRLARMALAAADAGVGAAGCLVAAALGERDVLREGARQAGADLALRLRAILGASGAGCGPQAPQLAALAGEPPGLAGPDGVPRRAWCRQLSAAYARPLRCSCFTLPCLMCRQQGRCV